MSFCCYGLLYSNIKATFGEMGICIYILMIVLMKSKKNHSVAPSNNTPRDAFTDDCFLLNVLMLIAIDAGPPTLGGGMRGVELDRPGTNHRPCGGICLR
jgi:hypothetical protein